MDADQVVMTEIQKELLDEVRAQYAQQCRRLTLLDIDPTQERGMVTLHLPHALLREAFTGATPPRPE